MDPLSKPAKKVDPPLVDLKVTNPVTYIKKWWSKVIGEEGIDFSFHIRPLTALAIAVVVASIGFGVGRFIFPFKFPFLEYETIKITTPTPVPTIWKETAFVGTLHFSQTTQKYFLLTSSSSEAITLSVPEIINLSALVGKRIFAIGSYNKSSKTLIVSDFKDLEVLSKTPLPLPTNSPSPTPTTMPTENPSPTPSSEPTASPIE